ncbi:MAG: glucose/sorbosone family PQQ-dependent dehydrogenase [Bacteroidota bacterium]
MIKLIPLSLLCLLASLNAFSQSEEATFTMTPIGNNNFLDQPWDLLYGPDGFLWVTERRRGVVLRVNPETAERDELVRIAVVSNSGQEGLLGIALHKDFTQDSAFVYLSYTYFRQGDQRQRIVRYTYQIEGTDGDLSDPSIILDNLPASDDHNSGRLIFGEDGKLYYTIGDQGGNQNRNYCKPILSQILPTQEEIDQQNWENYPGKVLRINTNGSIPDDNPVLNGVRSHIYAYGHRNAQGLVFGNNGLLYSNEHGPDTDDEVNIIYAGKNYGWPNIAGFQDDQAYEYCNWSIINDCNNIAYDKLVCPRNGDFVAESSFNASNYQEPIASMFAVEDGYDFNDPTCGGIWTCRPNVAPSSLEVYENDAIPTWQNSLLITSLKRGRIYRYQLSADGTTIIGDTTQHFYTQNRYRDIALHPDGKTFYVLCDVTGRTSDASGLRPTSNLRNPGNILKFTLEETVSTETVNTPAPFSIYPNPADKNFFIQINRAAQIQNFRAELIDAQGKVVQQIPLIEAKVQAVETSNLPAGLYFVRLTSSTHSWRKRVVLK